MSADLREMRQYVADELNELIHSIDPRLEEEPEYARIKLAAERVDADLTRIVNNVQQLRSKVDA
jgi:hypothetical protein